MPSYKLIYFDFKGMAEGIRLILVHAGQPFQEEAIKMEEWPKLKQKMPTGVLPVLEVDGKPISQKLAIAQYLGEHHGLMPKAPFQRAKATEMASSWQDMSTKIHIIITIEDKQKKRQKYEEILNDFIHPRLKFHEEHLSRRQNGFLTDQLSWADFIVYNSLLAVVHLWTPDMSEYKHVTAFMDRIEKLPKVRIFLEKKGNRPYGPYPSIPQMCQ